MSNKARERKSYSMEFKLRMLKEYYEWLNQVQPM